ncbi:MAG: glycerol kinase, partial [Sedimentisphaerales bacterium]|nr:glycerol kinase [Sedimentisphaerales bacterium]
NAARTMLYNIHDLTWDNELLEIFDIPPAILPEVKNSSGLFGETASAIFDRHVPITGIAGDQQAALFGQQCLTPGMVKNTYGTGCFLVMNTGNKPVASQNRLLTTLAWVLDGKPTYALEGSVFIAGAAVQWLRDGLGLINHSRDIEALAQTVTDNGGIYFVPALTGLGAPHWDPHARGLIVGLNRSTTAGHFARAALEAIAYQTCDVLHAMTADAGIKANELRVDGGASENSLLMQFQADLSGLKVVRPRIRETTALGAAFLAGLAVGFWNNFDELGCLWQKDIEFTPQPNPAILEQYRNNWAKAIQRAKDLT